LFSMNIQLAVYQCCSFERKTRAALKADSEREHKPAAIEGERQRSLSLLSRRAFAPSFSATGLDDTRKRYSRSEFWFCPGRGQVDAVLSKQRRGRDRNSEASRIKGPHRLRARAGTGERGEERGGFRKLAKRRGAQRAPVESRPDAFVRMWRTEPGLTRRLTGPNLAVVC
jgi:hypothetical protein